MRTSVTLTASAFARFQDGVGPRQVAALALASCFTVNSFQRRKAAVGVSRGSREGLVGLNQTIAAKASESRHTRVAAIGFDTRGGGRRTAKVSQIEFRNTTSIPLGPCDPRTNVTADLADSRPPIEHQPASAKNMADRVLPATL